MVNRHSSQRCEDILRSTTMLGQPKHIVVRTQRNATHPTQSVEVGAK